MKSRDKGEWKNEKTLLSWNRQEIIVGQDSDGDIGILDDSGYSIVLPPDQLGSLILHLQAIQRTEEIMSKEYWEPLGERVLVSRDEDTKTTKGGIHLPGHAELPQITG